MDILNVTYLFVTPFNSYNEIPSNNIEVTRTRLRNKIGELAECV
jgi:hypothetical protein